MPQTRPHDYALTLTEPELARYRMMAEAAREAEADLWSVAGIVGGATVADVGCGPGALFPAVVDAVGADGRVTGVDGDPNAVAQAQAVVTASGWANVTVQVSAADNTGLDPASYDVVMMRHVLAHNGPTEQAIVNHLASLVKPGGAVYLVDIFGDGFAMQPEDPDVDDLSETYNRFHAGRGNDLRTGLRLDLMLAEAGLEVIDYRGWYNIVRPQGEVRPPSWWARDAMVADGIATADDVARWDAALTRLATQAPRIFAPVFGAVGRRSA